MSLLRGYFALQGGQRTRVSRNELSLNLIIMHDPAEEAWQEKGNMSVHKLLVTAAFTLACTCAPAQSQTSLLDDMRAHPEKFGCSRTSGEGFSCPTTGPQPSQPADDMSWGEVLGQYFKPMKRWLWDHAPK